MKNIVEYALEIATEAHSGQVRKYTGEPYINHPKAVKDIVSKWLKLYFSSSDNLPEHIDYRIRSIHFAISNKDNLMKEGEMTEIIQSLALVHDCPEGCGDNYSIQNLIHLFSKNTNITQDQSNILFKELNELTRVSGQSYLDYILNIRNKGDISILVKLADLEHNLSDLKAGDKSEKYNMARYILLN